MGKALVVVEVEVTDKGRYTEYTKHSMPAVAAFGGRYIGAGTPEVFEGEEAPPRVVIVEFESAAKAREFYRSERYQAARRFRVDAAKVVMYMVEGPAAPAA